jgi:predicted O-methyltransferase YrrM
MVRSDRSWLPAETDLDWIDSTATRLDPVFEEIEVAAREPRVPILDRSSGRVLAVLAATRRRIVEVGTAYGYSTLHMALAQPRGGRIVTIDPDDERTARAREWWRKAGVSDEQITVLTAKALDALAASEPALAGPFDMVFIDAIKTEYKAYLDALIPRLEPGALVVADNVLWSGRVSGARPSDPGDEGTNALRQFDESVLRDPRFVATILPVGDGLLLATLRPGD